MKSITCRNCGHPHITRQKNGKILKGFCVQFNLHEGDQFDMLLRNIKKVNTQLKNND